MTRYFYDTEFLENGKTIELISIGIVADDGREYYAVNDAATRGRWWFSRLFGKGSLNRRIRKREWLMDNVVPGLPQAHGDQIRYMSRSWLFNYLSYEVKPKAVIAKEVHRFLVAGAGKPELWAYYGAYDHIVLAQLFGDMSKYPDGFPMFTNDIMQLANSHGEYTAMSLPQQKAGAHNAREDARHVQTMHDWIKEL